MTTRPFLGRVAGQDRAGIGAGGEPLRLGGGAVARRLGGEPGIESLASIRWMVRAGWPRSAG
ncbi:MAG: hypothetical protein WDN44_10390 [Sphingomonas sp.]